MRSRLVTLNRLCQRGGTIKISGQGLRQLGSGCVTARAGNTPRIAMRATPYFATGSAARAAGAGDREAVQDGRVWKGRFAFHLIGNRAARRPRCPDRPGAVARIAERATYAELTEQGLAVFDRNQKVYFPLRTQWAPMVAALA